MTSGQKRDRPNMFLRQGTILIGIRLCGVGITFLVTILLTRGLGAEGYGAYAFLFAIVTLAAVPSQLGLPTLVVRETTRAIETKALGQMRALWRWAHGFIAASSFAVIILFVLWLRMSGDNGGTIGIEAYIALLLIPLMALSELRAAILRGLGHDLLSQMPEHLIRPALFALGLLVMLLISRWPLSVEAAFAVQTGAVGLATLFGVLMLRRVAPRALPTKIDRADKRRWRHGALFMGTVSGLVLINNSVDIIMLGLWKSNTDVGNYRLAATVGALITLGLQVISTYAMPHLSRLFVQGETDKLALVVRQATQLSFGFSLLALIGLLVLGEPALVMVFGQEFSAAFPILLVLAVGHIANAFFGPTTGILMMTGHERLTAFLTGFGVLANVGLNVLLIPTWGPTGAAIATVASILVMKTMAFVSVWRLHRMLSWPIPSFNRAAN